MGERDSFLSDDREEEVINRFEGILSAMTDQEEDIYNSINRVQDTGENILGDFGLIEILDQLDDEQSEGVRKGIEDQFSWIQAFRLTLNATDKEFSDETQLVENLVSKGISNTSRESIVNIYHRPALDTFLGTMTSFAEYVQSMKLANSAEKENVRLRHKKEALKSVSAELYRINLIFLRELCEPALGYNHIEDKPKLPGSMRDLEEADFDFSEVLHWKAMDVKNSSSHPDYNLKDGKIEFLKPDELCGKGVDPDNPVMTESELDEVREKVVSTSMGLMNAHKEVYFEKLFSEDEWYSQEQIGLMLATVNNLVDWEEMAEDDS